jgi:putative membrane protein
VIVILRAALSALHVLALAIGFAGLYVRGLQLRELRKAGGNAKVRSTLLRADDAWGVAAVLWIVTGLVRAFTGLEKTPAFYTRNGFFWVKMALFGLVFVLEIRPMVTFIRWRIAKRRGETEVAAAVAASPLDVFVRLNDAEVALILVIPFVAALMARGAWLF